MLKAIRSPIRRSAADDNSELSPSDGREPDAASGATLGDCANAKGAEAIKTRVAAISRHSTRRGADRGVLGLIEDNKNNHLCAGSGFKCMLL